MKTFIFSFAKAIAPVLILLVQMHLLFIPNVNAQWTKTAGPRGINVNVFFDNGPFLFAGTSAKGVFRSANHGTTWQAANRTLENETVLSFTSDSNFLYAGTDEGVFRSSDNGLTWTAANNGIRTQFVSAMVIGGGYLFAGTIGSGVFKSADQGITWTDANGGALNSSYILAMCYVTNLNLLIVEGDNYLFKSRNAGNTWFIDQGNTEFYVIKHFLVIGDTVLASASGGVFHSYNGGITWSKFLAIGSTGSSGLLGFSFSNGIVYTSDENRMFSSSDYGLSWASIPASGLRDGRRFNNYFAQSGNIFLLGMDELGVFRSSDTGSTWSQSIKGFPAASSIDNALTASGDTILSGTHSDGIYGSISNGNAWIKFGTRNNQDTLSNGSIFALLHPAPNIILAGTCGDGLYRSDDNGRTWKHITAGLPYKQAGNYECDQSLAICASNILLGTTNGLFYSSNNGLTWHSSNLTGDRIGGEAITANGNVAVAGVFEGVFPFQSGIYRSTNKGVTWTFVQSFLDDIISLDGDGIDHFYGGGFFGNFRSTNNGLSWSSIGNGIPVGTGGFSIKVVDTSNVFIGNNKGIFFSSNQGNSFVDASLGLDPEPNNAVQGITANDNYLFAGLFQNAVWKRPLSDFGISRALKHKAIAELNIQNKISLYPNPATYKTILQYQIDVPSNISLSVSNSSGEIVLQSKEEVSAGVHSKTIDVSKFLPGLYFVQLMVNGNSNNTTFIVKK